MTALGDALATILAQEGSAGGVAVPFSGIPAIHTSWLWENVVANRAVTFLAGPGGTGKGLAIAAIMGIVTTGAAWPGEPDGTVHEPAQVILVAPEDDPNEDMAWRLAAAGANPALVRNLTVLRGGSFFRLPDNELDLRLAIAEAEASGPRVALIALDPLLAMCPGRLLRSNPRAVTAPLLDIAQERGLAVLASHHTVKSGMIAGSRELTDAARMVWMISDSPDDPDARDMTIWKSNKTRDLTVHFRIEGDSENVHAVFRDPAENAVRPGSRAARLRLTEPDGLLAAWRHRSLADRILSVPHWPCGAGPGVTCADNGTELVLLGSKGAAHSERVEAAIAAGKVTGEEMRTMITKQEGTAS